MNSNLKMVVSLFLFISLCFAVSAAHAEYICGDNNGDGGINISDAVYMINYVFVAGSPPPDPNCCGVSCGGIITDYDGNFYRTIRIGDQCWMMDNLRVTHYRNGDPIDNVTDAGEWHTYGSGAYSDYNNDTTNACDYGRLYNWLAVMDSRNIAPEGWHVATDEDWQTLADYLGGDAVAGGKIKMAGTAFWMSPNTGATNESGFSALPGGRRNNWGEYLSINSEAGYWTSSDAGGYGWYWYLTYDNSELVRDWLYGLYGLAVRCVKDQ